MSNLLSFAIGHTYKRYHGKVQWDLKVIVLKGYGNSIKKVEIHEEGSLRSLPISVCSHPEDVDNADGAWGRQYLNRFKTKAECTVVVRLITRDALTVETKHQLSFKTWEETSKVYPDRVLREANGWVFVTQWLPSQESIALVLSWSSRTNMEPVAQSSLRPSSGTLVLA